MRTHLRDRFKPAATSAARAPALPRSNIITVALISVAVTLVLAFLAFATLVGLATPGGRLDLPAEVDVFEVVPAAGTLLGLIAVVLAGVYAYRRQRITEVDAHSAEAVELSRRFESATAQLGASSSAQRVAGVYALSRLADEWPEQRQTCVDVLCAYLRMPPGAVEEAGSTTEEATSLRAEIEVRRTIQREVVIRLDHNLEDASETPTKVPVEAGTWTGCTLDLRRAVLYDWQADRARFSAQDSFDEAVFEGETLFRKVIFDGNAEFHTGAHFGGDVAFNDAFVHGEAGFISAKFDGEAEFCAFEAGKEAFFVHAIFEGTIDFRDSSIGPGGPPSATIRRTARGREA
ncbi:pentapeptide repeat-containing protein [Aquipuribacter sp. SD81]|uniref:pentapeptide repeat-containing protein n=1 Tax=Aquipuribacter sp. SD81 TaxID=3127703 RepID=UPI003015E42D